MKRVKYMYYCLYFEIPKHDLDYETVCNVFPIVSRIGLTFNCFHVLFSKQKDHLLSMYCDEHYMYNYTV